MIKPKNDYRTLAELFNINPEVYYNVRLQRAMLHARIISALGRENCNTVCDLLYCSKARLLHIHNLGSNALEEILAFIQEYCVRGDISYQSEVPEVTLSINSSKYAEQIVREYRYSNYKLAKILNVNPRIYRDVLLMEMGYPKRVLTAFNNVYPYNPYYCNTLADILDMKLDDLLEIENIGTVMLREIVSTTMKYIYDHSKDVAVDNDYYEQHRTLEQQHRAILIKIADLPFNIRGRRVCDFSQAFCSTVHNAGYGILYSIPYNYRVHQLADLLTTERYEDKHLYSALVDFIEWLHFDLSEIANTLFKNSSFSTNEANILQRRVNGEALSSISKILNLTVEQVSEAEESALLKLKNTYENLRYDMLKLIHILQLNHYCILQKDLAEYIGEKRAAALWYVVSKSTLNCEKYYYSTKRDSVEFSNNVIYYD